MDDGIVLTDEQKVILFALRHAPDGHLSEADLEIIYDAYDTAKTDHALWQLVLQGEIAPTVKDGEVAFFGIQKGSE